jgi:hypothetical protein
MTVPGLCRIKVCLVGAGLDRPQVSFPEQTEFPKSCRVIKPNPAIAFGLRYSFGVWRRHNNARFPTATGDRAVIPYFHAVANRKAGGVAHGRSCVLSV